MYQELQLDDDPSRYTGQMGLQIETALIGQQKDPLVKSKNAKHGLAKGFKQVEGLDYFETFAATCKTEIFRVLLQQSAKRGQ